MTGCLCPKGINQSKREYSTPSHDMCNFLLPVNRRFGFSLLQCQGLSNLRVILAVANVLCWLFVRLLMTKMLVSSAIIIAAAPQPQVRDGRSTTWLHHHFPVLDVHRQKHFQIGQWSVPHCFNFNCIFGNIIGLKQLHHLQRGKTGRCWAHHGCLWGSGGKVDKAFQAS